MKVCIKSPPPVILGKFTNKEWGNGSIRSRRQCQRGRRFWRKGVSGRGCCQRRVDNRVFKVGVEEGGRTWWEQIRKESINHSQGVSGGVGGAARRGVRSSRERGSGGGVETHIRKVEREVGESGCLNNLERGSWWLRDGRWKRRGCAGRRHVKQAGVRWVS